MKKLGIAFLAAIIAFAWSSVSWMVLPFQMDNLHQFKSEAIVSAALVSNTSGQGVYVIPAQPDMAEMTKEQKNVAMKLHQKKASDGPFALVAYTPNLKGLDMKICMAKAFAKDLLIALLLICLLGKLKDEKYWDKVCFIVKIVFVGALMYSIPNWIYWHFPIKFVALNIADLIIAWSLAGCVIAKWVK